MINQEIKQERKYRKQIQEKHFNKIVEKLFFDPIFKEEQKCWKLSNNIPVTARIKVKREPRMHQFGRNIMSTSTIDSIPPSNQTRRPAVLSHSPRRPSIAFAGVVDFSKEFKKERAAKQSLDMSKLLGRSLIQQVHKKELSNFHDFLDKGGDLSVEQIRKLKPELKEEYMERIIQSSKDMTILINQKVKEIEIMQDQLGNLALDVADVEAGHQKLVDDINQNIKQKVVDCGIGKVYDFKEFNILDMTREKCKKCILLEKQGKGKCPMHKEEIKKTKGANRIGPRTLGSLLL